MKVSREVKTAIMAIVAVAVLIFGYSFMKGHNIFDSSRQFYAVYDNVDGLSGSANITINGKKVGSVSDVDFLNDKGKILVTMLISNDFKFSKSSVVKIYSDGFIGGKSLKIIPKYKGEMAQPGDTLHSEIEQSVISSMTDKLEPLEAKFESALTGIDSLMISVNSILDDEGRKNLKESLAKVSETMTHLNNSAAEIDKILSNNSTKLDTTIDNLSNMSYNLSSFSDSLAQIEVKPLIDKVDGLLDDFNDISTKINNGDGTLGKLINDDDVYNNLDNASREMEELLQDIKLHPRRYINLKFSVFGGKNKTEPYKKPKDSLK